MELKGFLEIRGRSDNALWMVYLIVIHSEHFGEICQFKLSLYLHYRLSESLKKYQRSKDERNICGFMMSAPAGASPAGHDAQPLELDAATPSSQTSCLPHKQSSLTIPARKWIFPIPMCLLCTSSRIPLDSAPSLRSCPFARGESCWGTICMISFFVQLIKTLGRIAPEFLVPGGDDRQLPPRLASLVFSRSVCLFNVYLIK